MKEIINLERTANALDYYDRLDRQFDKQLSVNIFSCEQLQLLFQKLSEAGNLVGRAFGLDTADRNLLETCENYVHPKPWLRQKVAEWKDLSKSNVVKLNALPS